MVWFFQGLLLAFVCKIIGYFWNKIKSYINNENNIQQNINSTNFTPLGILKKQFFISIAMVLVPLLSFLFFKDFLLKQDVLTCILFISTFFGVMMFWGVIEAMFNEIIYYRNKNSSNNKSNNK